MANPALLNGEGSRQSIYEVSTTQWHQIGAVGVFEDGRIFRYGRYTESAALARGKLAVTQTLDTNHEDLATTTGCMVVGDNKITGITIGGTALTQDEYQYVAVVDSTNSAGAATPGPEGLMFRIRDHAAYSASATTVQLNLYDTIPIASDAGTQISLIKSPWADFKIAVTDQADVPAGVCLVQVPAGNTTAQYAWVQTYGPSIAWVNGTPGEGTPLVTDTATAGNLTSADETIKVTQTTMGTGTLTDTVDYSPIVAYQMGVDGTDDEVQAVFLTVRGI